MSRNPTMKNVIATLLCFTVVAAVAGQAVAEVRMVHKELFARPAFADASAMFQQLPKPDEKPRLYLCNSGDGLIKDQELWGTRQKATSGGVWASILQPEFAQGFCEWKGRLPFKVKARQLELWLLVGTPKANPSGTVVLKVRILKGDSTVVEHDIELLPKWPESRDGELVEVLERWDVDELDLKEREELTIQFASKTRGFSIIGYGVSHLTFRNTPRTPSPQTAVWLRSREELPDVPLKVSSNIPDVAGAMKSALPNNVSTISKGNGGKSRSGMARSKATATRTGGRPTRLWTDNTGVYTVEAEFRGVVAGKVRLRKETGDMIEVPLDRLCEADKDWIYNRSRR